MKTSKESLNLEYCFNSDDLYADYFNAFLALPVFPEKIQYRSDHRAFEVKHGHWNGRCKTNPHQRNMITLVREDHVVDWLAEHRLPLLHDSCLYIQYRLAKHLSDAARDLKITSKQEMDSFMQFVKGTAGEERVAFWLTVEEMNLTHDPQTKCRLLRSLRDRFFKSQRIGDFQLEMNYLIGLTASTLSLEKVSEAQGVVLSSLAIYWLRKFFHSQSTRKHVPMVDSHGYNDCGMPTIPTLNVPSAFRHSCEEDLVKAMSMDKDISGKYVWKFLVEVQNKEWMGCYCCWFHVQALKMSCSLNLHSTPCPTVLQHAKAICSQYTESLKSTANGAVKQCFSTIRSMHHETVADLYKVLEGLEWLLQNTLLEAWKLLRSKDREAVVKMPCYQIIDSMSQLPTPSLPHLSTDKTHSKTRDKKTRFETPPKAGSPASPQCGFTFDRLLHNRVELEHFKSFLSERYASRDLLMWLDIEEFLHIPLSEDRIRRGKAQLIKSCYLHKQYFFSPVSPATKQQQKLILSMAAGKIGDRPSTPVLLRAQKSAQSRIESRWLPVFVSGKEFQARQRPRTNSMSDIIETVMSQQHWAKRMNSVERETINNSQHGSQAWKTVFHDKWLASSKDICAFRRGLLNPVTCFQFRKFVSIKNGGNPFVENDILFWLEAEQLKVLCSSQVDTKLIHKKIQAVVSQFIDSAIPPVLQINIPSELAQKIRQCHPTAGTYLMREAQEVVSRVLFTHWLEFCKWNGHYQAGELPFAELEKEELQKQRRASSSDSIARWKPRTASLFSSVSYNGRHDDLWVDDQSTNRMSFSFSLYCETGQLYVRNGKAERQLKRIASEVVLDELLQSTTGRTKKQTELNLQATNS